MAKRAGQVAEPKTIEDLMVRYKKKYGPRGLDVAADVEELYEARKCPTGIPQVDEILGGGLPRGHVTEVFGPWSGGKTFFLLMAIAQVHRDGGKAAFIDTEVSFSPGLARAVGVDLTKLYIKTPEYGEKALDLIIDMIKLDDLDLIVLDSATSITPKDIVDSEVEIAGFPAGVRLWNAGLARIKPVLAFKKTALAFTNQVRENIGVMYGPNTTEPMGQKSKHEANLRLEVRRKEWIKTGDQKTGQISLFRVVKTKIDGVIPYAETTIDIPTLDLVHAGRPAAE